MVPVGTIIWHSEKGYSKFLKMLFFFFFEIELVGQKGGCIIVDSTRKGKRFPDSMSKTIPIWTCVLNRSIRNHLSKMNDIAALEGVSNIVIEWCSL